jgi:hypothetical protein
MTYIRRGTVATPIMLVPICGLIKDLQLCISREDARIENSRSDI